MFVMDALLLEREKSANRMRAKNKFQGNYNIKGKEISSNPRSAYGRRGEGRKAAF